MLDNFHFSVIKYTLFQRNKGKTQMFNAGDYISQVGSDYVMYGYVVQPNKKKGSYKIIQFTSWDGSIGGKPAFKNVMLEQYPGMKVISAVSIPIKILAKIEAKKQA